jgi:O-antigen ligase
MPAMNRPKAKSLLHASDSWAIIMATWLCVMILFGGNSTPALWMLVLHSVISMMIISIAVWRLRTGFPSRLAAAGAGVLGMGFLLMALQLVPLPPSLWAKLPGRELVAQTFAMIDLGEAWLPLSLTPDVTRTNLLALLPFVAGFLGMLSFPPKRYYLLAIVILGCALASVFIGLLQRAQVLNGLLAFYGGAKLPMALGTFGNRNYLAAQLFSAIPLLGAFASDMQARWRLHTGVVLIFVLFYTAVMLAGLAVTGSRGGLLLAMASVFLTLVFVYRSMAASNLAARTGFAAIAAIGGLLVVAQASMLSILRLAQNDPLADFRSVIAGVTWKATQAFWPVGSGFGSFVPVYQIFETPADIIDEFANHAHNDWLEIALEGGVVAVILEALFLALFLYAVWRIIRVSYGLTSGAYLRAGATVIALLGAHSIVDFGVRTPALLSLFAVCCGWISMIGSAELQQHEWTSKRSATPAVSRVGGRTARR